MPSGVETETVNSGSLYSSRRKSSAVPHAGRPTGTDRVRAQRHRRRQRKVGPETAEGIELRRPAADLFVARAVDLVLERLPVRRPPAVVVAHARQDLPLHGLIGPVGRPVGEGVNAPLVLFRASGSVGPRGVVGLPRSGRRRHQQRSTRARSQVGKAFGIGLTAHLGGGTSAIEIRAVRDPHLCAGDRLAVSTSETKTCRLPPAE